MKLNPLTLARSELGRRIANGVREAVKCAPDNARKAVRQWREKREERT